MQLTQSQARPPHVLAVVPSGVVAVATVAALCAIFALDCSTGPVPVQHLYYLPIGFAAIRFGMRGGLLTAVTAIVMYHLANPHMLTFSYVESDVIQVVLFVAIAAVTAKLTDDARRLHALAMTDDLTGLHNLRSFELQLGAMVRDATAGRTPLALMVLDLDHLKAINEAFGHLVGAEAVRTVGRVIAEHAPAHAVACRYGGDEFVVALPRTGEAAAAEFAEVLRGAVYDAAPVLGGRAFAAHVLSISVGVAAAVGGEGEALFRAADAALYRAKDGGRNQVCTAVDLAPSTAPWPTGSPYVRG